MSGRFKTNFFIILAVLIVAMLLGPPLALATKLPTACSIFQEKKVAKLGTCGHQITFSKDKFHFGNMEFPLGLSSGNGEVPMVQPRHYFSFIPTVSIIDLTPIRC